MNELAITIKTFMREKPLFRLIDSIKDFLPDCHIYISDDSKSISKDKRNLYKRLERKGHTIIRCKPYSGVSVGKNALVKACKEPFLLMLDDDFVLDGGTDYFRAVNFLKDNPKYGLISGVLKEDDRDLHYEYDLEIIDKSIVKREIKQGWKESNDLRYLTVDLALNFFVARKKMFDTVHWFDPLVTSLEHMDFFLEIKYKSNWKVAYTPDIIGYHIPETSDEYGRWRWRVDHWPLFGKRWKVEEILETDGNVYLTCKSKYNNGKSFEPKDN